MPTENTARLKELMPRILSGLMCPDSMATCLLVYARKPDTTENIAQGKGLSGSLSPDHVRMLR